MTPISTISALAQGLVRRAEHLSAADVRDRGERIWRASRRLHELIDTIMAYTRANAGAITPNPSVFGLRAMVLRVCQEQGRQEPGRPFELNLEEIPEFFLGDPILLEQAFVIVLSNATKYSPQEQPVSITCTTDEGTISLAVHDRGVGVSERDLPHLMQPFFRGRNARNIPGTGLGLSLALHILQLHHGTLKIESKEGHGTTVTITLPLNENHRNAAEP